MQAKNQHISVAPMMDWTDRHCRYFHRLISPHIRLYTEMVTTGALIHGDAERFLRFNEAEHPVALQLGGSDPDALARCAELGARHGYDEINLNCGCPSDRVQSGSFGACLMKEPELVASCIDAMNKSCDVPVTVKCRIGIDEMDDFDFLDKFVGTIADKNCKTFIIHARKAWLKGLSPKQNREVPELIYQRAVDIKEKYPHLEIILNGGITDLSVIHQYQDKLDGFMIGREAYQNPYFLAEIERKVFGNHDILGRVKVARAMIPYMEQQCEAGVPLKSMTRHIIGLFHHQNGAKAWRRAMSTLPHEAGATPQSVIEEALKAVNLAQKTRIVA